MKALFIVAASLLWAGVAFAQFNIGDSTHVVLEGLRARADRVDSTIRSGAMQYTIRAPRADSGQTTIITTVRNHVLEHFMVLMDALTEREFERRYGDYLSRDGAIISSRGGMREYTWLRSDAKISLRYSAANRSAALDVMKPKQLAPALSR